MPTTMKTFENSETAGKVNLKQNSKKMNLKKFKVKLMGHVLGKMVSSQI